jgi:hypothetical protein
MLLDVVRTAFPPGESADEVMGVFWIPMQVRSPSGGVP